MAIYPPKYDCFKDKESIYLDNRRIDSFADFKHVVDELRNSKEEFIYRGISDASYKMYSSAQRYWIDNKGDQLVDKTFIDYDDYLQKLVDRTKVLKVVNAYLEKNQVHYNEMWLLSLMQHYSAPSVMLDFSHDLISSLFFMCDGAGKPKGDGCLDDYVSLYYMKANLDWVKANVQNIMTDAVDKVRHNIIPFYGTDRTMYETFLQEVEYLPFSKYRKDQMDFVGLEGPNGGKVDVNIPELGFKTSYEIINGRLKTQAGLFFANFSETEPFAELLLKACTPATVINVNEDGSKTIEEGDPSVAEKHIYCLNVNKRLLNSIKWYYLYPRFIFKWRVYRNWNREDRLLDAKMKEAHFAKK